MDKATSDLENRTLAGSKRKVQGEVVDDARDIVLARLKQFAWLLDESILIPGLNVRMGIDSLIGLIPGIGDLISAGLSAFIIKAASQLGVPKVVLLRMSCNSIIDAAIGSIPFLGDVFDVHFKANKRNVALAIKALEDRAATEKESYKVLFVLLLAAAASLGIVVFSLRGLWQYFES